MISIHGDAKTTDTVPIQPLTKGYCLSKTREAGAITRVHRVQRFKRERHTDRSCMFQEFGHSVLDLSSRIGEVA